MIAEPPGIGTAAIWLCLTDDHGATAAYYTLRTYLRDRDLQRGIEEGLNVVEAWNGANAVICYGRRGEISTNRHEEVEMTALCLRILQAALVYATTLMLQDVLTEGEWAAMLGPADRRGLTPLFWQHVRPYGEVRLDMGARLRIGGAG